MFPFTQWRSQSSRSDASTPLPVALRAHSQQMQTQDEPIAENSPGIAARLAGSFFSAVCSVINLAATPYPQGPATVLAPHDSVDWEVRPAQDEEPDSSDDERNGTSAGFSINPRFRDLLQRPLCKPGKRWAWAEGRSMNNSQVLKDFGWFLSYMLPSSFSKALLWI